MLVLLGLMSVLMNARQVAAQGGHKGRGGLGRRARVMTYERRTARCRKLGGSRGGGVRPRAKVMNAGRSYQPDPSTGGRSLR